MYNSVISYSFSSFRHESKSIWSKECESEKTSNKFQVLVEPEPQNLLCTMKTWNKDRLHFYKSQEYPSEGESIRYAKRGWSRSLKTFLHSLQCKNIFDKDGATTGGISLGAKTWIREEWMSTDRSHEPNQNTRACKLKWHEKVLNLKLVFWVFF